MEFHDHDHDDEEPEDDEEEDDEEINLARPQSTFDSSPHQPSNSHPQRGGGNGSGSVAVVPPNSSSLVRKIAAAGTKYEECLKNHAVSIGGYATDGCGEFLPAGEEGTLDALKCAACGCHRNFHRRETDGSGGDHNVVNVSPAAVGGGIGGVGALYHALPPYGYRTPTPTGYLHVAGSGGGTVAPSPAGPQHLQYRTLALPSSSGGTHSRDEMEDMSHPSSSGGGSMGIKKRFRTKFSQEQKEKMLAFAEKLGWRMQKHDEAAVQQFCQEVQVKRQVLKVWMHNNKHTTLGKKAQST